VLATANASETLTGFYTKYDTSSGDIGLIGSYSKREIRKMMEWLCLERDGDDFVHVLRRIMEAEPSAELAPGNLSDEQAMGITYEQIDCLSEVRMAKRSGPHSMAGKSGVGQDAVHKFYQKYTRNRHKTTTLPPTFHGSPFSPDDNRFDLRPIVYPADFN